MINRPMPVPKDFLTALPHPRTRRRPPAEDPAHRDAARGCQGRAKAPTAA